MDHNGSQTYEGLDDIEADHVTINQGGAGQVKATTVEVTQGGIQAVEADHVTISQGGAFIIEADSADLTLSGAGLVTSDNVNLHSGGAGVVVADTLKTDPGSVIGVLFAGTIEGQPNVKVDARRAAAFGAAMAVTLFVLRRVFSRR
jgi:hypothetical protein